MTAMTKTTFKTLLAVISASTLVACSPGGQVGGTGGTATTGTRSTSTTATVQTSADTNSVDIAGLNNGAIGKITGADTTQASYDIATDTVTLTSLPFDVSGTFIRAKIYDHGNIRGYVNTSGLRDYIALFATSSSGNLSAVTAASTDYINHGWRGYGYWRASGTGTMPTTGEARYTGDYSGLITFNTQSGIQSVTGNVFIDMDYLDGVLEGGIYNRVNLNTGANMESITLATTPISTGVMTGATGSATGSGTYQTVIYSPNSDYLNNAEFVGIIVHDTGGQTEIGVFEAN